MDFLKSNKVAVMACVVSLLAGILLTAIVVENRTIKVSYKDTVIEVGSGSGIEEMKVSEAIAKIYQAMGEMQAHDKVMYMWTTNEMVRFVEKQYIKVTKKPDDFYPSDLVYCFDNIWPYIPDEKKSQGLILKYKFLLEYYESKITEASPADAVKFSLATTRG